MTEKIPIKNYQRTHAKALLKLTEKLFNKDFFDLYLTSQQLVVLGYLLSIPSEEDKLKAWDYFLKGNITLNVEKLFSSIQEEEHSGTVFPAVDPPSDYISSQTIKDNNNTNINSNTSNENRVENQIEDKGDNAIANEDDFANNDEGDNVEEDLFKLDLEDLKQQISGTRFIGNLSLKIRYVLWQCAIDYMYCDHNEFDDENDTEYTLLDVEEKEDKEEIGKNDKPQNQESVSKLTEDEDYDDEDENYDEDSTEVKKADNVTKHPNSIFSSNIEIDDERRLMLNISISKETLSKLKTNNVEEIMGNWNKIYHSFEYDKETMIKRLKLEESDKMIEKGKRKRSRSNLEAATDEQDHEKINDEPDTNQELLTPEGSTFSDTGNKRPKQNNIDLTVNLGIENLSLKHLLSSIQPKKSQLGISDYELKHLIMDVRKNRSKWTSDERIGQEELYEACEKVVLELRNYTEHSTPFLNKVSKREAPNYHQIIKKSMDLNTVLKKLKSFQYDSKQEFVDDIMLIWKNCLTYNSDPSHFLRGHAIAMQKKSLQLIPMIPNITIRNRADLEKEIEDMEKDKDFELEEEEEVAGSGRKGLNMGAHMLAKKNDKTSEKGNSKTVKDETPINNDKLASAISEGEKEKDKTALSTETFDENGNKKENGENEEHDRIEKAGKTEDSTKDADVKKDTKDGPQGITAQSKDAEGNNEEEEEEDDDEDEDEDMADSQSYLLEKDDDRDDLEISVWKTVTAKVRAEICLKRADYFKNGKLNSDSEAFLKNPQRMKNFNQLFLEYKEQKALESYRQKIEQDSIMKNGFGTVLKQEDDDQLQFHNDHSLNGNEAFEKQPNDIELDDTRFLQEYDISNAIPDILYEGVNTKTLDKMEDASVDRMLQNGINKQSRFLANKDLGLTPKMNENITLIQQIRHICHKISLIRMLQSPLSAQNSRNNPNAFLNSHIYNYTIIDDSLDIDPVSQLPTHDYKNNRELIWKFMHKNVSKVAMANGFETAHPSAINMLTEIAGDYLSNLIKTLKLHHETNSLNRGTNAEMLQTTLLENGINRPDDLYSYVESEFGKKTKKLQDIKQKLENFLRALLRPTLQELSERNFEDESQSFFTGDFASELTGEDFFGFRELGLEKEFGVLSSSVPLQLLTTQFQTVDGETKVQAKKIQPEESDSIVYKKITKGMLDVGSYLNTLLPLLRKDYERSKAYIAKQNKSSANDRTSTTSTEDSFFVLLEEDQFVSKKTATKARLPPTGKISTAYKKKPIASAFILPEEDLGNDEKADPATTVNSRVHTENDVGSSLFSGTPQPLDSLDMEDPFDDTNMGSNSSFSLSLPRLNQ
ncbi:SAGA histone acetyltransferase complex subunit SPT7 [Saccharomyces paradoxus]|uniref:SAGA complex subunit Spt7 n=1 Tax=Saccharomyces paradoxus TaxID=27291 RepID=A0A8B8UM07_SACPA|nr:Spt7 [Saccharomyces paradoxus]QHS71644.1 Spt7 [Saccharomyces paradoxus]